MSETTLRRPGRPRKAELAQEPTPVVEQAADVQEQPQEPQQVQYVIAKLTPHMLAGEIQRLYQEGEDLSPVHMVSDAIRADAEPVSAATQPDHELKAAVEAAKTSQDRPRTFAVAYRGPRGAMKVVHGVEHADGSVHVEDGHGNISGYEGSMKDLKGTIGDREHYIDYTDES